VLLALLIALLLLALTTAAIATADHTGTVTTIPDGGAAGGPALYLPQGDLLNVRNIQGGVIGDPNLDIGAGSTEHPGNLILNWDVGVGTYIYDGRYGELLGAQKGCIRLFAGRCITPRDARRLTRWLKKR